jgi:hypothetical protein
VGSIAAGDELADQGEEPFFLRQRVEIAGRTRAELVQLEPHWCGEQRVGNSKRRLRTVAKPLLQRPYHVAHRLGREFEDGAVIAAGCGVADAKGLLPVEQEGMHRLGDQVLPQRGRRVLHEDAGPNHDELVRVGPLFAGAGR